MSNFLRIAEDIQLLLAIWILIWGFAEVKSKKKGKTNPITIVNWVLFAIIGAFFGAGGGAIGHTSSRYEEHDYFPHDEDLYACPDEWRRMHPYDYNPFTGGSTAEEDHGDS